MFEKITHSLSKIVASVRRKRRLTETNVREAVDEIRSVLLEADVALDAVEIFISALKEKVLSLDVIANVTPAQTFIYHAQQELVALLGGTRASPLEWEGPSPVVGVLVGLQGVGKTTVVAKLAAQIKASKKSVAVVSCDVHRPAATKQLAIVAGQVGVPCYSMQGKDAKDVAQKALATARREGMDVLLVDTAGRLHVDRGMMDEVVAICESVVPKEILYVADGMLGQDAINSAKSFDARLSLSGHILTKLDSDTRAGVAMSLYVATKKPIKMVGTGEQLDALDVFYPERMASRILGMGDVESLVELAKKNSDKKKSERLAEKMRKGRGLNLVDMRYQLLTLKKMGGVGRMLEKIPGLGGKVSSMEVDGSGDKVSAFVAIIDSMTPEERFRPAIMNGSRKLRVARGCGLQMQMVNQLLKNFNKLQKLAVKGGQPGNIGIKARRKWSGLF